MFDTLVSSQLVQQVPALTLVPQPLSEEFRCGFNDGVGFYEEVAEEGKALHTLADVWAFLHTELSPKAIERDNLYNEFLGVKPLPLERQIGFVVGYLTGAFARTAETASTTR